MKRFRQIVFWMHLLAGIITGVVIAIMSFTGATLAFEKEIIAWAERDVRQLPAPSPETQHLSLDDLLARVREAQPGQRPSAAVIQNDPGSTVLFSFGRTNSIYVNPFTGEILKPASQRSRKFLRVMNDWHRYLGREGDRRPLGKAVTGACNAAFLVLAVSGLYLWWPRKWSRDTWRAIAAMRFNLSGKARDWNWHNAVGFWIAPVLIVLTVTALPISYRWAGDFIYWVTASSPPVPAGPAGGSGVEVTVPPDGKPLPLESLLAAAKKEVPDWKEISLRFGGPSGRGGERRTAERNSRSERPPAEQSPES
ncbi:MAG: PepSY domain-containing protein, partial [Akkermansiaceae bacterium]|nr:PepSY domain-containing protein [Verrucomicrobiales bacterium]